MTDAPNIILVVFDTMRKDVLGTYGGAASTPNVAALAQDGVVYGNCVTPSPWTTPSHVSLFTGLYPSQHGIHETRERKSPQLFGEMNKSNLEPVASSLRAKGYNTIGYSANPSVSPGSGFDLGFNNFTLIDATRGTAEETAAIKEASKYGRDRSEVTSYLVRHGRFLELLKLYRLSRKIRQGEVARGYPLKKGGERLAETVADSSLEQPFFLFLNLFEMHEPYTYDEPTAVSWMFSGRPLSPSLAERMRTRYRQEAAVSDSILGSVMSYLRQNGAYDDSLVIVTSDHGQCLSEHGYFGHGTYLYDELIEAPLITKFPGNRKVPPKDGYQSLTRLSALLKSVADGEQPNEDSLTAETVLSEAFGIAQDLAFLQGKESKKMVDLRDRFEVPRKAAYREGYKLVVSFDGKVEEFSQSGKPIDPRSRKGMLEAMIAELKDLKSPNFEFPAV